MANFNADEANRVLGSVPVDEAKLVNLVEPIMNAIIKKHSWYEYADDIKQEALIKLIKLVRENKFNEKNGALYSFLYKCMENKMHDWIKANLTPTPEKLGVGNKITCSLEPQTNYFIEVPIKKNISKLRKFAIMHVLKDGGSQQTVTKIMRNFKCTRYQATKCFNWALVYCRLHLFDETTAIRKSELKKLNTLIKKEYRGTILEYLSDFMYPTDLYYFLKIFSDINIRIPPNKELENKIYSKLKSRTLFDLYM